MNHALFTAALLAATMLAQAEPVYKCTTDGKTSYTDHPCAHGASTILPPAPAGVDAGLGSVRGDDSRTQLELEKLRIERARRELAVAREDRRASQSAAARGKRCARQRLRVQWASDDVERLHGRAQERARVRVRRQRELLAAECPG